MFFATFSQGADGVRGLKGSKGEKVSETDSESILLLVVRLWNDGRTLDEF